MKRKFICIIIFTLILSGCTPALTPRTDTDSEDSHFQYATCLTLNDITSALSHQGLNLIENREESPAYYQIDDTMPFIFNVKDSKQMLLIYVFKDIAQLKQVYPWGGLSLTLLALTGLDIPQKENYPLIISSTMRNVLIVDMIQVNTYQEYTAEQHIVEGLRKAVLSLNDAQRVVFADQGTYWDARLVSDYYEYWYKDDKGTICLDHDSEGKWTVKYTGPNPESIQYLKYEYNTGAGGVSGTLNGDSILEKIGDSYFLRIGSSDDLPSDGSITLTIEWDSQKESLNLTKIK
jgi:hypothetical protein